MQLQGTIKYIGKVTSRQGKDGKTYTSQKMLLVVLDGNYSNTYPIDISPKLQDHMDQFMEGQMVTVHYNMRGNEYLNKNTNEPDSFLSLSAWKIESQAVPINQQIQQEAAKVENFYKPVSEDDSQLPF